MGEIADDMIDGTRCSWCGQYFQDPKHRDRLYTHGFPVICKDCNDSGWFDGENADCELRKLGLSVSTVNTL